MLLLILNVNFTYGTCQAQQKISIVNKIEESTIALVLKSNDGKSLSSYCSGIWVSETEILSAAHCVIYSGKLRLGITSNENLSYNPIGDNIYFVNKSDVIGTGDIVRSGRQNEAIVSAYDEKIDLALLKVSKFNHKSKHDIIMINQQSEHILDSSRIYIVGHPEGLLWTYFEGYVSAVRINIHGPAPIQADVIQIASPATHGNSGSGVCDEKGNLIGVFSYIESTTVNVGFAIHHDTIVTFLKTHGVI